MTNKYEITTHGGREEVHFAEYHEVFNDWFLLYDKSEDLKHTAGVPVAAFHQPQSVAITPQK